MLPYNHNADLLWEALPQYLVALQPMFDDQEAKHLELAALLCISQTGRRDQLKAQWEAKQVEAEGGRSSWKSKQKKARQLPLHNLSQFIFEEQ